MDYNQQNPPQQPETFRPFAQIGNFTQVHNWVFDSIMPIAPPNAFKVLMFVIRQTEGWNRPRRKQTNDQIMAGTGISHRNTVTAAIKWLLEADLIIREGDNGETFKYYLNKGYEASEPPAKSVQGGSIKTVQGPRTTFVPPTEDREYKGEDKDAPAREDQDFVLADKSAPAVADAPDPPGSAAPPLLETDDVVSRCIRTLERVPRFPKDRDRTMPHVAGLVDEFPNVDAEQVCRDYAAWHDDHPRKTKDFLSRLRNFFKNANEWAMEKQEKKRPAANQPRYMRKRNKGGE